ncbi:hypothetical protein AgCh_001734 [Apium graveolens]
MSKSPRRATIRAICEEIVEEFKTPAVRRSIKASNVKEVSTVQRVYSTRRSARLTEQSNVESIPVEQKEEKIVSLAAELSKIDLVDVTDDKSVSVIDTEIMLQEPLMKSDADALEIVSNIKDNEFNDQKTNSEKILKVVDELNTVQVCLTNSLMIENENENENVGSVKEEIVNELEEKAELLAEEKVICESLVIKNQDQEYAMDTENPHEQVHGVLPESRTDLTYLRGDNDLDKIVDEQEEQEEQSEQLFDTLDEAHFVHEVIIHNMEIEEKTEEENGFAHGKLDVKQFAQEKPVNLRPGINHISLLCMTLGIQNNGAHMGKRLTGPDTLVIKGLNTGTLDLTQNNWGHEVGVGGEKLQLYTEEGAQKVKWGPDTGLGTPTTWYKKGHCWINGNNIGRYWASFITPLGKPSQSEYHIPRATSPSVHSYERKSNQLRLLDDGLKEGAQLHCPTGKVIEKVEFASFGDPIGACRLYSLGKCHSPISQQVVEQDEQQLDNVDSYSDKSADSKERFSDGSTYPWDALPINELDDKVEQLLDDLDIPLKFCNIEHRRVSFFAFNMGELPLLP